ncbi:MAG: hypothetical protein N2517_09025 [Ignavibacteria bacterium]|nr:hypothetical protein [Ignavibacteria bacterium]
MENIVLQTIGLGIGLILSSLTLFLSIRKEIRRNQNELLETRLKEERRAMTMENRINLLGERLHHFEVFLQSQLENLGERITFLFDSIKEQIKARNYET